MKCLNRLILCKKSKNKQRWARPLSLCLMSIIPTLWEGKTGEIVQNAKSRNRRDKPALSELVNKLGIGREEGHIHGDV